MSLILKSARWAEMLHGHQTRKWGRKHMPYVSHVIRVAGRVATLKGSTEEMVAAAFLHDVVEDTEETIENIEKEFGSVVAGLVLELTNPSKGRIDLSREERKSLDREHLKTVSQEAKIIKLVDRIDNVSEILDDVMVPTDFRQKYFSETKLLLEVLSGVDYQLEAELESLI
jgi:(p)ppGpp synthase/HD superfamily hydrolase